MADLTTIEPLFSLFADAKLIGRFLGLALLCFFLPVFVMRAGREWLVALLPIYLITANVFAGSFFALGEINNVVILMNLAVPIYAGCFVVTDLLSEFYSKSDARHAVWAGLLGQGVFLVALWTVMNAPIESAETYRSAFTFLPRLILGSFVAYLVSNLLDIGVYHAILSRTGRAKLWLRNNVSTFISQGIDTAIFLGIAFWGVQPVETPSKFLWFFLATWAFKSLIAGLDTAALYAAKKLYRS